MVVKGVNQRAGVPEDPRNEIQKESPEGCTAGTVNATGRDIAKTPDMK